MFLIYFILYGVTLPECVEHDINRLSYDLMIQVLSLILSKLKPTIFHAAAFTF